MLVSITDNSPPSSACLSAVPIICALRAASDAQRQLIREAIEHGQLEHLPAIQSIIVSTGALEAARQAAQAEARRALEAAKSLPANEHQSALLQLAAALLERRS